MKNDYVIEGDVAKIKIVRASGEVITVFVDAGSIVKLAKAPKIYVNCKSGYPVMDFWSGNKRKHIYLHRFLTEAPPGKEFHVDHINNNVLDNRLCNLRIVTASTNASNRKGAAANSKSGVRGISWHKKAGKWIVQSMVDKQYFYLGIYDDIEEAKEVLRSHNLKHGIPNGGNL